MPSEYSNGVLIFRCTENGNLFIWNKELVFEPDRPNGLIYHGELIFDDVKFPLLFM